MKIIKINYKITPVFAFLLLLLSMVSCKPEVEQDVLFTGDEYQNMMQFISENDNYSSFDKIAKAGKMTDALSSYNSNGGVDYTLFLPNNEAVSKFLSTNENFKTLDALLLDGTYCAEIVKYHLVNGRIPSTDFPNGALPNKTISNYYLTIFFREANNTVSYAVNDESKIIVKDIKLDNGTIHTIDKMLTPVVFTSYQWLEKSADHGIFAELLQKCGLADTLNAYETDELGRKVYNEYTMLAESNTLYASKGISSFSDLISKINPTGGLAQDFSDLNNPVNKYARYHILVKSVFLDEFTTDVYNTYGESPISVDLEGILKFNRGAGIFDSISNNGVKTYINYMQINADKSNVVTRSGAIHQLNHLLFPFLPSRKTITYQFYEEPVINALKSIDGEHIITFDKFENINLIGSRSYVFVNSQSTISGVLNSDYLRISGNVDFVFKTPKILAGRYTLKLVVNRGDVSYSSIQAVVDGQNVGLVLDLSKETSGFKTATIGTVEFFDFNTRIVRLNSVIPGNILIDRIIFEPI